MGNRIEIKETFPGSKWKSRKPFLEVQTGHGGSVRVWSACSGRRFSRLSTVCMGTPENLSGPLMGVSISHVNYFKCKDSMSFSLVFVMLYAKFNGPSYPV